MLICRASAHARFSGGPGPCASGSSRKNMLQHLLSKRCGNCSVTDQCGPYIGRPVNVSLSNASAFVGKARESCNFLSRRGPVLGAAVSSRQSSRHSN